jgi:hypothetical protein
MGKFVPQILRHFDLQRTSAESAWKADAAWLWRQSGLVVEFRWRGKPFPDEQS